MQNAIEIKDLKKTYKKGTQALKGVSLKIAEGDFFALLGPNGAGKTTLISILSSLANKSEGEVSVFGASLDRENERAKTYIGLVPQEFNFNIFDKCLDIAVNQAGYYGIPRKEALARAEELFKTLNLWEKRKDTPQKLSGGMKRRLMIARALIHRPKLLILDEPTAGVDVELRRSMWEYLTKLNESGTTIILTTHYLEEAQQLCKKVAVINHGEIVANESMQSLISRHGDKKLEDIFLEMIEEPKK
jgi:ABC-2 type transport system ATP-binding protein